MSDIKQLPYIEYVKSDKSSYPFASTIVDERTDRKFIDDDNDFRVGNSGGFLMNIDFVFVNTHLFNEVGRRFEDNKIDPDIINWVNSLEIPKTENRNKYYYCPHLSGTREYIDFWTREVRRRRNGMVAKCKLLATGDIVDLHITGDHYNYLNYSRINRTPTDSERAVLHSLGDFKTELISAFPRFWDGDYWNFKIDLFIARNNYHLAKGKARGKGYSYKRGSQAANTLNLVKKATVVLAADLIDYLTDADATAAMVKTNLDWLEDNTHWKRGYLSENLEELRLGFKTKSGGNKPYGVLSKLFSVSLHNNESAAIGKRAIEIDFEEAGKCGNLEKALGVTLSSTEVGATNVGTIRVYGTAGTKEANWTGFANVFYTSGKFKMMPFENVWDYNGRNRTCGFFHPQVLNMEPFMDADGNSLLQEAYNYDRADKERQRHLLGSSDYIIYVGQRANTPEEAFKRGGENIFSSPELSDHYSRILADNSLRYYRDGMYVETKEGLVFKTNEQLIAEGHSNHAHPYIEEVPFNAADDFYGCIREYYPPPKINGLIPKDICAVVYDTVGKDKKSDLVINKNSLNSIYVVLLPNDLTRMRGNTILASYSGRPESMEEADRIALKND
jgi:hypothetical protein